MTVPSDFQPVASQGGNLLMQSLARLLLPNRGQVPSSDPEQEAKGVTEESPLVGLAGLFGQTLGSSMLKPKKIDPFKKYGIDPGILIASHQAGTIPAIMHYGLAQNQANDPYSPLNSARTATEQAREDKLRSQIEEIQNLMGPKENWWNQRGTTEEQHGRKYGAEATRTETLTPLEAETERQRGLTQQSQQERNYSAADLLGGRLQDLLTTQPHRIGRIDAQAAHEQAGAGMDTAHGNLYTIQGQNAQSMEPFKEATEQSRKANYDSQIEARKNKAIQAGKLTAEDTKRINFLQQKYREDSHNLGALITAGKNEDDPEVQKVVQARRDKANQIEAILQGSERARAGGNGANPAAMVKTLLAGTGLGQIAGGFKGNGKKAAPAPAKQDIPEVQLEEGNGRVIPVAGSKSGAPDEGLAADVTAQGPAFVAEFKKILMSPQAGQLSHEQMMQAAQIAMQRRGAAGQ